MILVFKLSLYFEFIGGYFRAQDMAEKSNEDFFRYGVVDTLMEIEALGTTLGAIRSRNLGVLQSSRKQVGKC